MKYLFLLILIFLLSCDKKDVCKNSLSEDKKVFQCHDKIEDFSFLKGDKYKNLEALDLTNTLVKDLSFLEKLKKLRVLLLINTKINKDISFTKHLNELKELYISFNVKKKKYKVNNKLTIFYVDKEKINILFNHTLIALYKLSKQEYNILPTSNLRNYKELLFSLYSNYKVKKIDLFRFQYKFEFDNIKGITQLKTLEILKIYLNNDKNIKHLNVLSSLKELHLAGNIRKIVKSPNSLKKLYLYNMKIQDFDFLENSKIEYLYILTDNVKSEKWKILKKSYPNIIIKIENLNNYPKYYFKYIIPNDKDMSLDDLD